MNKAVLIAAALAVAPVTLSAQELQGSKDRDMPATQTPASQKGSERVDEGPFKERIAEAIETVEGVCAADIEDYCGTVPSGGGRLALCMLSHEDMLSARCRFGLYRATRKLKTSLGQAADTCLKEIRGLCGETGGIRQCLEQKKDSLSSSCQMIVSTVGQRVHRLMGLVGLLRVRPFRERRLLRGLVGSGHHERPFCAVILPFILDLYREPLRTSTAVSAALSSMRSPRGGK